MKNTFVKSLKYIWNSFELFLLIFLLLYVFFESYWLIVCIIFGILGKLYNLQDYLLYHPQEPPESKFYVEQPSIHNLPYEVVDLLTYDNLHLHSYLLKQRGNTFNTAPTMIFFHGNAGNIGQRIFNANYFYSYCEFNVLLVEYRGYGLSEGVASERGFYLDAEAASDYLFSRNDIDKTKIILFGQSIGGAVAIHTAYKSKHNFLALIVENTFTTLPDIGKELFNAIPCINLLPDICFKNQYRSLDKVKHINMPCLFISGLADTLVPPKMMMKLYEKCNAPMKRMVKIEYGDHNGTWQCPGYFQGVNKFFSELQTPIQNEN